MGTINVYDKILTENQKEIWKSNKFVRESPCKRWFTMEFKAC